MNSWENEYKAPSENRGDNWRAAEHVGELTLFLQPASEEMDTQFGETIAAVCTSVIPLEGEEAGMAYSAENGVAIFGNLGKAVLDYVGASFAMGVVTQGKAKPGRSAPFILSDPSDEQRKMAFDWMDENLERGKDGRIIVKADEEGF